MSEALPAGGIVTLWAGWEVALPPCRHQQNDDESWSAWGRDWVLEVQIHEVPQSVDAAHEWLDGYTGMMNTSGRGWQGQTGQQEGEDAGRKVYRLAGWLDAGYVTLACCLSYLDADQAEFASTLIGSITHS
ncbi:hypothetical protein [Leeia oryzae]|uniref:hypothetical protein n=1 Tax=Leeia oryzae TaxID=356662 RepID=UPI00035E315E|nr:hypothetical protein [Leeia oryzae]